MKTINQLITVYCALRYELSAIFIPSICFSKRCVVGRQQLCILHIIVSKCSPDMLTIWLFLVAVLYQFKDIWIQL